jgi:5-methylcytosine-specific restriction endonuclease McrA
MDTTYTFSFLKKKDNYRKSVPKTVKDRLWDTTFGPEAGQGLCYVCGLQINSKRFEAGHVISVYHGGSTTLDNLKCICSTCNKSMGTQHLEKFKLTYFPAIIKKNKDKKEIFNIDNNIKYKTDEYELKLKNKINNPSFINYKKNIIKDEEELQRIQNIKINFLDKYKYVLKK